MTDQERYHRARSDGALVVIEGLHALKHAIRFGARLLDVVTDDEPRLRAVAAPLADDLLAGLDRAPLRVINAAALDALTPAPHPTRVVAIAERPAVDAAAVFANAAPHAGAAVFANAAPHAGAAVLANASHFANAAIVVLDDPRHAGNIGAAIRVAAAAGATGLFVIGSSDPWHPAAVRGAAGLQFALPVARLDALPPTQRVIIGVDPAGDELGAHDASPIESDAVLVFGSERDGISAALEQRCMRRVRIPMRDGVSSLNLATAVAIMLYHGGK